MSVKTTVFLFFIVLSEVFAGSNISKSNIACTISTTTQTTAPQPVYIHPGTSNFFHPTTRRGQLQLAAGQEIELFCSGDFESPAGAKNSIIASCVSGQTFSYNGFTFQFNQFKCRDWPTWSTRNSSIACYLNGILVDVGFQIDDARWLNVYTACHDIALEANWYVHYKFTPFADGNQFSVVRPSWTQRGHFTASNVDFLYQRNQQRRTVATILGDQRAADTFIEPLPSDFYMARGHLAAMTDFLLATEQQASFHFLNAAPQWQTFNSLTWVDVEVSSRRLAGARSLNLDVWTGTFGVTELWNERGTRREIFLDWPAGRIPAPKIYYKVLINNADMTGVVLIGVNNPHLSLDEIQQHGYIVCPDVSDQISYVKWQRTNLTRGYGYACNVNDFARAVPHVSSWRNNKYRLLV